MKFGLLGRGAKHCGGSGLASCVLLALGQQRRKGLLLAGCLGAAMTSLLMCCCVCSLRYGSTRGSATCPCSWRSSCCGRREKKLFYFSPLDLEGDF